MILNALVNYYDRLEADPEQGIAAFGFSRQKISFEIVLRPDGTLFEFHDAQQQRGKRRVPKLLIVPGQTKSPGKGFNPCFLWDNAKYVLGFKPDDPKPERTVGAFEAYRERHLAIESEIDDEAFSAVCRFLQSWNPAKAEEHPVLADITGSFGVFRILGARQYVHERPKIVAYWKAQLDVAEDPILAPSLVSGDVQPIARLHQPSIKGVGGTQTSGAAIVSFNRDAFESYGKSQSFNAPVGVDDAFKYCTALDHLTSDDRRRIQVASTTIVYWSEKPTQFESGFGRTIDDPKAQNPTPDDPAAEDQKTLDNLEGFFNRLRQARRGGQFEEDADVPFYVLGLSPSRSRLSVRFWLTGTVQQFAERLGRHVADLEIVGCSAARPLTLRRLVRETALTKNGWPDEATISPLLQGAVFRSVLEGTPYPQTLLAAVIARIRAEGFANPDDRHDWRDVIARRAAILKAYLIRNWSVPMDVYLNKNHPEKAYHCGRLLAVLAFAQEKALGTVNSGVVRRNLGSVMAMPGLTLGRLQRAAEVGHIPKLKGDLPTFIRDEIKSINVMLRDALPVHLDLRLQGVFALGFYQQSQYLDFIGAQLGHRRRWRTSQGEWVRSKLEVRVANTLATLGIVYIYELSAVLPGAGERWPDFVIKREKSCEDIYIEVLGMNTAEYNARWEKKRAAYEEYGITEDGGSRGRLLILDFRGDKPFDENTVVDALRDYVPIAELTNEKTNQGEDHE